MSQSYDNQGVEVLALDLEKYGMEVLAPYVDETFINLAFFMSETERKAYFDCFVAMCKVPDGDTWQWEDQLFIEEFSKMVVVVFKEIATGVEKAPATRSEYWALLLSIAEDLCPLKADDPRMAIHLKKTFSVEVVYERSPSVSCEIHTMEELERMRDESIRETKARVKAQILKRLKIPVYKEIASAYAAFELPEWVSLRESDVRSSVKTQHVQASKRWKRKKCLLRKQIMRTYKREQQEVLQMEAMYAKLYTYWDLHRKNERRQVDVHKPTGAKKFLNGCLDALCFFQSGRVLRRQERDEWQKNKAKEKAKQQHKSVPKQDREKKIKQERDKRNPAFQGFKLLPSLAGAGTALVLNRLWQLLSKADKALDGFNLQAVFSAAGEQLKKRVGGAIWYIPLVLTAYYAIKARVGGPPILVGAIATVLSKVLGPHIWNSISKVFHEGDVEFQVGGDFQSKVAKLLATMFTFSVFKNRRPGAATEFCKRLSLLERMSQGWESFLKWMLSAIECLVNQVRKLFGKERLTLVRDSHGPTYDWAKAVDVAAEKSATAQEPTTEEIDVMVDLIRQGYVYKEIYRGSGQMSRFVDEYLVRVTNALMPFQGSLSARNNFRFEPSVLMICGSPGVGKTVMAMQLAVTVLLESGILPAGSTFDQVVREVWQKGSSEYWNGYAGQACLVMDDAFQYRANPADKDNDYMGIIRMVSSWSFPLNFADLASKGKNYFSSKFIFGTTNLKSLNSEARVVIHEPEAVVRRLNHPYCVRVSAEYQLPGTTRLDYSKYIAECKKCVTATDSLDRYPWYVWEAARHDYLAGTTADTWVNFRQVVYEVAADLRRKVEAHAFGKDALRTMIEGYTPKAEFQSGLPASQCSESIEPSLTLERFKKALDEHLKEMSTISKVVAGTLGLFFAVGVTKVILTTIGAVVGSIWRAFKDLFSSRRKDRRPATQSNRPANLRARRAGPKDPVFQSLDRTVTTNIYGNTYKAFVEMSGGGIIVIGQILFLESDLAVQPRHFTEKLLLSIRNGEVTPEAKFTLRNACNPQLTLNFTASAYLALQRDFSLEDDVEFLRFGKVRAHRNITANFMREEDLKSLRGYSATLDICDIERSGRIVDVNDRKVYVVPSLSMGKDMSIGHKKIRRFFQYQAPTTSGDCGAPLCVLDNSTFSGRTCMGFHVAGNHGDNSGYSVIVTQDMIRKAKAQLEIVTDNFEADARVEYQACHELPFDNSGSFLPIGVVSKPVPICPKSAYYKTALHGFLGPYNYLPAHLGPRTIEGETVFPMNNAVKPYSSPVINYDYSWMKQVMYTAMWKLKVVTKDMPRDIYTFDEAILGIPEQKFRSIPRGTSAGFPYVYDIKNGKFEFFGNGERYDLTTPKAEELRDRVKHIVSSAAKNVRLNHVFVDFLKDELRPEEKVKAFATRLISSSPLDYTVAVRMYFGAFTSAVMRCHTVSGMAPGICTYTEWDKLAMLLRSKGDKCFDGDFKAFDSSEQPSIHQEILDYINDWYDDGESNARIRRVLWLELVHSRHIGGNGVDQRYVYQWNKSLPSGHPLTTIVNSMYSLFLLVACYRHLTGDLAGFWDHVFAVTYGDDNAVNVDDVTSIKYNQVTVAQAMHDLFQVRYTSGRKDGILEPYMDIGKLTFLKRAFVKGEEGWLCPLELDSFLYTAYWCKNRRLESTILTDVLENSLEELSMHGQDVWDKYAPKIVEVLEERVGATRVLPERGAYLDMVQSRSDNWY